MISIMFLHELHQCEGHLTEVNLMPYLNAMTLTILPQTTVRDLNEQFQHKFPFLKLAFFHHHQPQSEFYMKSDLIDDGEVVMGYLAERFGPLQINGHMHVETVEEQFFSFGLNVQVMRLAGTVWLNTTVSDVKTLSELNRESREANYSLHSENQNHSI